MKNEKTNNEEYQTIEKDKFQLGWYDKKGYLNKSLLHKILVSGFIFLFISINYIGISLNYLFINSELILSEFFTMDYQSDYIYNIWDWYRNTIIDYEYFTVTDNFPFIIINTIAIITPIYLYVKLVSSTKKKAEIQSFLASNGLSQYYLYNANDKTKNYMFKLIKGENINFEAFMKNQKNLCQFFQYSAMQSTRIGKDKVLIVFSSEFPTLEDTKPLNVDDYLKKDYIFMGVGIPNIGEKYLDSDLINNKFLPRYVSFNDLPIGIANLGSAGGGKSVSMSQYLSSIFFSFDLVSEFYFIDFKGGIESEPIRKMEVRLNTGKIEVLDDNRLGLYKMMKRLNFINKSRMKYVKDNGLKKFKNEYIVVCFDELAEILDYEGKSKNEKKMQNEITQILESLLRTGRSQNLRIFYSTQSYLSTSSGLTAGMKNNTKLKIAHQLGSRGQVGSIMAVEDLDDLGIYPTAYDVGRNVVINEQNNTIFEVRSLYVPDDFTEYVNIEVSKKEQLDMNKYYKETYEVMKETELVLNDTNGDDEIYSLDDIARDLGFELGTKYNNFEDEFNEPLVFEKEEREAIIVEEKKEEIVRFDIDPDLKTLLLEHKKKKVEAKKEEAENIDNEKLEEEFESFDLEAFEKEDEFSDDMEKLEDKKAKKEDELMLKLEKEFEKNINEDGIIEKTDDITDLLDSL